MQLFKRKSTGMLPPPGVHHFLREDTHHKNRLHLRVETDGSGFLLVNANNIYFLNPTAMAMAWLTMNEQPDRAIIKAVCSHYAVDQTQAAEDLAGFQHILHTLIHPDGECPICDLHLEMLPARHDTPIAPYRMDLALTYHCNNNCGHCYNARSRSFPELTTTQWKQVLDRCWEQGIPHIVFTGGEPTLREDLPELVAHAQQLGQITGINTNGRRLKDKSLVQRLVDAGLDHVQITFESADAAIHDQMQGVTGAWQDTVEGIKNVLDSSLYMMTNTTMLTLNQHSIPDTLAFLAQLGVPTVGLNALIHAGRGADNRTGLDHRQIEDLLEIAKEYATAHGQRLIWYTPTQYCHFNPIIGGVGAKGCSAAMYNMCVEPNGDVLPCQSYYQAVGNLLADPWEVIWHHPLCESIRRRDYAPDTCHQCSMLDDCGGGCPLAYAEHAYLPPIPFSVLNPEELEYNRDEIPE
ncbi:MAG: radical SAM protein [Anaerolineae bacterium]|nr:radical SAM protein [Anaerolineae bacterium]